VHGVAAKVVVAVDKGNVKVSKIRSLADKL
jgi:hypothetical protein